MADGLTPELVTTITHVQQASAILSLIGCAFIISTFSLCKAFHKPINRMVFFASFANVFASSSYLLVGVVDMPDSFGCQFQAAMLQAFVASDVFWTTAMAVNVYLTFYHRFDAERLRRLDVPYFLVCYLVPMIPAITYIFVRNEQGHRIYGSAILWCWITPEFGYLRIATFYGPIWALILITLAIYVRSGATIYKKRRQLMKVQDSNANMSSNNMANTVSKTTEVTVTHDGVGFDMVGHEASAKSMSSAEKGQRAPKKPRQGTRAVNRAAWQYTRCALLFFIVILITWIPSSANRLYSMVNPGETSVVLHFMGAAVLPLQGFWNAIIYGVTSWSACKSLLKRGPA
ncbi:G-protein coupled receptor 1 [Drechmeria coniospora]|uniref:G-protein coupled receptor 1 n=1 Tax=Drechmeria coniospora TaxID=98403 RepID=A0A151GAI1_DRECN|nr:G-protein coupled receptor 1 [Drechmeria coniospora]KYK54085.1 G-protein coupled receptor 1 [Drechmeria coniospora]ODA77603.1 hypothetical protein RJ55_07232 [Drechmeria coniospora]